MSHCYIQLEVSTDFLWCTEDPFYSFFLILDLYFIRCTIFSNAAHHWLAPFILTNLTDYERFFSTGEMLATWIVKKEQRDNRV